MNSQQIDTRALRNQVLTMHDFTEEIGVRPPVEKSIIKINQRIEQLENEFGQVTGRDIDLLRDGEAMRINSRFLNFAEVVANSRPDTTRPYNPENNFPQFTYYDLAHVIILNYLKRSLVKNTRLDEATISTLLTGVVGPIFYTPPVRIKEKRRDALIELAASDFKKTIEEQLPGLKSHISALRTLFQSYQDPQHIRSIKDAYTNSLLAIEGRIDCEDSPLTLQALIEKAEELLTYQSSKSFYS